MKLAPINPAPPVTRSIFSFPTKGARILSRGSARLAVVVAIPGDESREPFVDRRLRGEAGRRRQAIDRRVGRPHVARLQRQVVLYRAAPKQTLELGDKGLEPDRPVVADVVDGVWRAGLRRRLRRADQHAYHAFDNIVDVGEVALHVAVIEYLD